MILGNSSFDSSGTERMLSGWRITFVGVFLLVFCVAVVAQLFGLDWRSWFSVTSGKSLWRSVDGAVYTLMAHIS